MTPRLVPEPASNTRTASLVFIYGPPAAGKLTVARALADRMGCRVAHNHMAWDVAGELFARFSEPFNELIGRVRLDVADVSLRSGVSLVMTMVFGHPEDLPFMSRVDNVVSGAGGCLCRVHLRPEPSVLERRVLEPSRGGLGKLQDLDGLREALKRWDVYTPVDPSDLSVDNSELSAIEVAEMIQNHYELR